MISIIIPTFNEGENIGNLLQFLNTNSQNFDKEILVVDAGSTDSTRKTAKSLGAKVLISPKKGRAKQMNFGAEKAKGKVLYFLHADTFPPPTFIKDIYQNIKKGFDCGRFLLSFDNDHSALKFYSWFTRFNLKYFHFGDQSLYVMKALFHDVGGFNEKLTVMEDQEIIGRLKNRSQFSVIKKSVVTSARRYEHFGVFKLQMIFSIIVLFYYMGVNQKVIVDFYKKACAVRPY